MHANHKINLITIRKLVEFYKEFKYFLIKLISKDLKVFLMSRIQTDLKSTSSLS